MDNPFTIVSGEKLTLNEAMDRFFNWEMWNREHHRADRRPSCDSDLYTSHLCCDDHVALRVEHYLFFAYLFHLTLDGAVRPGGGFSMSSLKNFLADNDVTVDPRIAAKFCYATLGEWFQCPSK